MGALFIFVIVCFVILVFLFLAGMESDGLVCFACIIGVCGMIFAYLLGIEETKEKFLKGEIKIENKTMTVPTVVENKKE